MTKQEILDKFNDIDFVYNDSSKHETLSRMIDELLKEQKAQKFFVDESGKITPLPVVVRCKDCKYGIAHGDEIECKAHEEISYDPEPWHKSNWFCADGERRADP